MSDEKIKIRIKADGRELIVVDYDEDNFVEPYQNNPVLIPRSSCEIIDDEPTKPGKIITIELSYNGSTLFETEDGIPTVIETLKPELKQAIEDVDEGEEIVFKIKVCKTRTQKFVDNLGEFDGF